MRKDYADQSDCCPDCVNENNEAESCVQCDDDQCCSCCCSCCSGSESEVESRDANAMESNPKSIEDSFRAQKKNLISSLSITRTNRERATIQNVLQYVEALTHSSSFLRRYNLQEDFCLQCLEESFRDLYTQSSPTPNPSSRCASNGCNVSPDVEPNRNESQVDGCLECSPPSKAVAEGHRNRNRRIRSRMRSRNSTRGPSNRQNRPANSIPEHSSYDSDCSECRRGIPCQDPQELGETSECECCQNPTNSNVSTFQQRGCSSDKCADCNQNSRLMSECCSNFHDGHCPEGCCESDYEACGRYEAEGISCACCSKSTSTTIRSGRLEPAVECGRFSEASDKESEPCNCEECRDSIECSDQSCDECTNASRNSNRKKKNKK